MWTPILDAWKDKQGLTPDAAMAQYVDLLEGIVPDWLDRAQAAFAEGRLSP